MDITAEQEEQIRQATLDFKKAMKIRSKMNIRVAARVTSILRISMLSFGLVTLMLLIMLFAFTSKMDEMIVALDTMNIQFTSMSKDMTMMRGTLSDMESNIAYVPVITQMSKNISGSVGEMYSEVDSMNRIIVDLNREIFGITNQVSHITGEMRALDPAVQNVGRDVNRMSGPMRMFNKVSPFD